ncbi:5-deoxy-glucuronate isomerase [Ructibacterium gallinarum]|uniref:5-deoxy-glucuronate isomerase n=1 Tax=Ructibacterium gallinarum TaxID=2779355 RepID=A0A9D5M396_9FIRM|nr:5-deoxy-glucuronate isomerase [Ructibacterium gallinarum]MBE5040733.1 5-deoxy-glucuronate isomerase [Ructibacterium gallinarum]
MNLKRTWNKKYGKSVIYAKENSGCQKVEIDMLRLRDGETKGYKEKDKEYALVVLGGKCTVTGEDFSFKNVGKRKDVFDGPATCVYLPANQPFSVTAVGEVSIAVCKSPSVSRRKPILIQPEDVVIKQLGKPGWEREAHFILDERTEADMLYIGEAFVKGGQWASYPPHKHDDDNMPTEAETEEIYYYEFKKPQGFGVQRVYTMEGDIDEIYTVKSGDFVEIPKGYHPFHAAPGYDNYYLWVMAGKDRGFFMTTDQDHAWLNQ